MALFFINITFCFRHVLHKYANEDVSLGSWLIGLDVEHIDERSLCCGTQPGLTFQPTDISVNFNLVSVSSKRFVSLLDARIYVELAVISVCYGRL